MLALAWRLEGRREVGSGLLRRAERDGGGGRTAGIANASRRPAAPLGLPALLRRQHQGPALGWLIGLVALAGLYGLVIGNGMNGFSSTQLTELLNQIAGTGGLVAAFVGLIIGLLALAVAAYTITVVGQLGAAEQAGQTELVLATPLTATRWYWTHLALAVGLGAGLMLSFSLTLHLALTFGSDVPAPGLLDLLVSGLTQLPGLWFLTALAALGYGLSGRTTALGWLGLALCLVLGEFGPLMKLPTASYDWLPQRQLPVLPLGDLDWPMLARWLLIDAALAGAGWFALRRRQLG
jgi:ABC-2 type transport system permease protein